MPQTSIASYAPKLSQRAAPFGSVAKVGMVSRNACPAGPVIGKDLWNDPASTFEESELLRDTGLPQHRIRGVPRPSRFKVTFVTARHRHARTSLSSCSYRTWNFPARRAGTVFNSSNSGMRILSFRARLLGESASATRPGMSSLSATQTPASLSHRASTSKMSWEPSSCTADSRCITETRWSRHTISSPGAGAGG